MAYAGLTLNRFILFNFQYSIIVQLVFVVLCSKEYDRMGFLDLQTDHRDEQPSFTHTFIVDLILLYHAVIEILFLSPHGFYDYENSVLADIRHRRTFGDEYVYL